MTNELGMIQQGVKTAEAVINQVQAWPVAVALVACLIVLRYALMLAHVFPNRAIPLTILIIGGVLNVFVGDVGKVDPTQRYPSVVLAMFGVILAFLSLVIRAVILKKYENYIPLLAADNPTETTHLQKNDNHKP